MALASGNAGKGADDSKEAATLVEFRLEDAEGGTLVTVTESGFDRISLERRAKAFADNSEGWEIQMAALDRYVVQRIDAELQGKAPVFAALGDETRLQLVTRLCGGEPLSITQLASGARMSGRR